MESKINRIICATQISDAECLELKNSKADSYEKTYFIFMSLVLSGAIFSQTFSDDFESYTVGSYLGSSSPDWTTWSGVEGGAINDYKQ